MGEVGKNEQGWYDLCQELQRNDTEVTEKVSTSTLRNTLGKEQPPPRASRVIRTRDLLRDCVRPGLNPDSDHRLTPDPAFGLGPPLAIDGPFI